MQFVRAPDENVFIAPLNLIEIVVSGLCEWWMPKHAYEVLNDLVMGIIYAPLLFVAAFFETRKAADIRRNRARGEEDDDIVEEWEQMAHEVDFESEGWAKKCEAAKPNVEEEPAIVEVKKLRSEIDELKSLITQFTKSVGAGNGQIKEEDLLEDTQVEESDSKGKDKAGSSSSGAD